MDANSPNKLEQLLRLEAVERISGLKKSSIYAGVKSNTFPSPVRLSARAVAWRESDLVRWQASRQTVGAQ